MNKRLISAVLGAGALAVSALAAGVQSADAASTHLTHLTGLHAKRVCVATPAAGHATCLSKVMVNKKGVIPYAATPLSTALSPVQLKAAYSLTGTSGAGRTVAIVDAYGYPNLERDLTIYRNFYGMPACTTSNGCLKIVNQTGGSSLPRANTGWDQEQALDVDAVSATCPDCKILVVQAKSSSLANLGAAVNQAAKTPGVVAISNSYGGGDSAESTRLQPPRHRHHRIDGRQRIEGRFLPGLVRVRHCRRWHLADDVGHHPRQGDRLERRGIGLLDRHRAADLPGLGRHGLQQAGDR